MGNVEQTVVRNDDRRRFRISVDTGGTFTDVALCDQDGNLSIAKALTRSDDPWGAILEALEPLAARVGSSATGVLARTEVLTYATTRATNAILTGSSARTAFVTTAGFPDILTFRQGGRLDPFDFMSSFPEAYVPRELTFELEGRIDAQGEVVRPFDPESARTIVRQIVDAGCAAVAVCLLWAHVNPEHELAFAATLAETAPDVAVTLSHRLNPVLREYPRASSTAIDASLKPLMQEHFAELSGRLTEAGFTGSFLAVTAVGGCLPAEQMIERPIYSIDSGPSVAPVAGRVYAREDHGHAGVIVYDTGGTSFDVTMVLDGEIAVTRDRWLGQEFAGHLLGISSVGVHSIGAGGGSIAWIDDGGLLSVGPISAGSEPGPACYGRGGDRPTVTDAAAVLGYLDPEHFNAGRLVLDLAAARSVIDEHIAVPLGLGLEQAAAAIIEVANARMVGAIREISVNQGTDPRECLLLAGGGAGGMNVVDIARDLGITTALVPRGAGTLSAVGAQLSDLVAEFTRSEVTSTAAFGHDSVERTLGELDAEIDAFVSRIGLRGPIDQQVSRTYFAEGRYPDQVWDLRVPVQWSDGHLAAGAVENSVASFHDLHERTFAVSDERLPVEFQNWIGRVVVGLPKPDPAISVEAAARAPHDREVWFGTERLRARCVEGSRLTPGAVVRGPAIIEEATTTVVLPPGSSARVSPLRSYLIETGAAGA